MKKNVIGIIFMSGERDGETVAVELKSKSNKLTIGRSGTNDLCISNDPGVSRSHANLYWEETERSWKLEDLKSSNGTFVGEFGNSQRISRITSIREGQIFRVGCTRLCIKINLEEVELASAYAEQKK